ncbi:MAG: signal peptidase II [Lachnospiraceae bacterium]|nr:signal peptidase II [Lachnospiraceae bacterium]
MKWSKHKRNFLIFDFISIIILIAIDQYTKYLAVLHLKDKPAFSVIDGVFELNYLENRGAAFGMLQNQKGFFILISCIVLLAICYILVKIPEEKKYNILHILLVLIASGAVGNMIDRIRLEYVVDFFYFVLINFPIFNMADIYVSVACILLTIVMLFIYKEEDLDFLSIRPKKVREIK